ncbi:MAG TPA: patatin-like phospholipase family protein [Solirubrobacteraceae bacterium]
MRVLAIDGGGIRGIIPAIVLAEVERVAGKRIHELFDLIAGTSTGGILACALTAPPGRPAEELVELYRTEGPKIFKRSLWQRVGSVEGLLEEKHDDDGLEDALRKYLGDTELDEALTKVLVTAYDLEAREPFFFKSWRTDEPGRDFRMRTVARATAAAPTYFEPARARPTDGGPVRALVDGGVFATNPAMCAFAEAQRLEPGSRTLLLSLGTGQQTKPIRFDDARGWGLVEWVRPVIDIVFDGVADTVDYQLRQVLAEGDYVRLQVVLDRASDALDDAGADNLARLEGHAHELVAASGAEIARIVAALSD